MIRPATPADAEALAAIHAAAFEHPWDAAAFRDLLTSPGVTGLIDEDGLILIRLAADEAEFLTLATAPAARRRGLGRRLVQAGQAEAAAKGALTLFLEVAIDNHAALALYRRAGFTSAGTRAGYYARAGGAAVDALVLKKPLTPPA